jgi:hypothetical protein
MKKFSQFLKEMDRDEVSKINDEIDRVRRQLEASKSGRQYADVTNPSDLNYEQELRGKLRSLMDKRDVLLGTSIGARITVNAADTRKIQDDIFYHQWKGPMLHHFISSHDDRFVDMIFPVYPKDTKRDGMTYEQLINYVKQTYGI